MVWTQITIKHLTLQTITLSQYTNNTDDWYKWQAYDMTEYGWP